MSNRDTNNPNPPEVFIVRLEGTDAEVEPLFEGTLGELAHRLRSRKLMPSQVNLLRVVQQVLERFDAWASRDLELATEALPAAAGVVELKARLLLPRPPVASEEEEMVVAREEVLAAVAALEALEDAIAELRDRRERRGQLLPARAPTPTYPRRPRPMGVPLGRLVEIASRLRPGAYFEMARDRLTMSAAIARLRRLLRPGWRQPLDELVDDPSWGTRTIYFAGALELVREGRARLHQDAPFATLEAEGVADVVGPPPRRDSET